MSDWTNEKEQEITAWHHQRGLPRGTKYAGPEPVTLCKMATSVLNNISVHLANEHKINPDGTPDYMRHVLHMRAHMLGTFRPGQEHYHGEINVPSGN